MESKSLFMVSSLKLGPQFLLIASQPPACSDVGTGPSPGRKAFSEGPGLRARLPFGMGTVNVIFPPQSGREREKGVADETTGLSWGTARAHVGGLARMGEDVRMRIESG